MPEHTDNFVIDESQPGGRLDVFLREKFPAVSRGALQRLIDAPGAYALDVVVPHTEHVLPMIPANKTFNDIITD